jgi:hypothetical protein
VFIRVHLWLEFCRFRIPGNDRMWREGRSHSEGTDEWIVRSSSFVIDSDLGFRISGLAKNSIIPILRTPISSRRPAPLRRAARARTNSYPKLNF